MSYRLAQAGGYLLKQTFGLALNCAASFSHTRSAFNRLDQSTFQNPVPVGLILYLTATVAYTDEASSSTTAETVTRVQVSKLHNASQGSTTSETVTRIRSHRIGLGSTQCGAWRDKAYRTI